MSIYYRIEELLDSITDTYVRDFTRPDESTDTVGRKFRKRLSLTVGKKYIRIVNSGSAWGFVVNTHDDSKFAYGDVLKPASWKTPARNFSRHNVFNPKPLPIGAWAGI